MSLQLPVSEKDHSQGDLHSPLVIVHYGDFECPYSAAAAALMVGVQRQLGEKLLYVFRPFPLSDIHPHALQAAEAGQAAAAQGQFWSMYALLFEHQDRLKHSDLLRYAAQMGLDVERFEKELKEHTHREAIGHSIEGGRQSGAHGTPTFFINGEFFDNRRGLWQAETMVEAIESVWSSD
jgi:protein-disulfide isomerase